MRRSFAPTADGGASLFAIGMILPGVHRARLSSAAMIDEHLRNFSVPRMAIQNSNHYNVSHSRTITTSDEAITGFTDPKAEVRFYSMAKPQVTPPQDRVDGVLRPEQETYYANVRWLPGSNEIVVYSQPGSDVPTTIYVTVRAGRTILGLDFEGGTDLTVSQVRPYVLEAVRQIVDRCGSMDIMALTHG
jgi:hypothetical protein